MLALNMYDKILTKIPKFGLKRNPVAKELIKI